MLKNLFKRKSIEQSAAEPWLIVQAPLSGKVIPLSEVDDPVFAQGMVGDGIAILPESDEVLAPVSGSLTHMFPTGHAAGITTAEGLEILIHVGLDTVELKGDGFAILVEQGQQVTIGTPLIKLDLMKLRETARSLVTPVIITNMDRVKELSKTTMQHVEADGDWAFKVRLTDGQEASRP